MNFENFFFNFCLIKLYFSLFYKESRTRNWPIGQAKVSSLPISDPYPHKIHFSSIVGFFSNHEMHHFELFESSLMTTYGYSGIQIIFIFSWTTLAWTLRIQYSLFCPQNVWVGISDSTTEKLSGNFGEKLSCYLFKNFYGNNLQKQLTISHV
jgi:hypothetical protein